MFGELFEQVFLPEDIRIDTMSGLCVLRDSLALVTWDPPGGWRGKESLLCMWARDGDHWNKKYSIGPILGSHRALAFQQNGELLLLRNKDYRLVSCNLDTQNMKEHHLEYNDSRPEYPYILRTLVEFQVFTENLVSVKRCAYWDMICSKQPALNMYSLQCRRLTNWAAGIVESLVFAFLF